MPGPSASAGPPSSPPPTAAPASSPESTQPEPLDVVERRATDDGTTVARLSNGLVVVLKAVPSKPVVCVRAYVHTGGLYEGEWLGCGISHLTEHLVAKGAVHEMGEGLTASEAKQTSDRVGEIGGQSNAYTSLAHTCYYIAATAEKTTQCIDLVADWMARPEILPEDFRREHGVVQRELEMGKDDPTRQLWYAHMQNCFRDHPAAVPVIGCKRPLSELRREDVLAYHRRTYVPQNMVFCVVGDIDVETTLGDVRRAFAGFAAGRTPSHDLPEAPPIWSLRRVVRSHPAAKDVAERISFQTVPLLHQDLYALDVLSYILTQGESSRLVEQLERQKRLVLSISSSSWTPTWGKGIFTFAYRSEADKADAAEQAILRELRKIVAEGVTEDELARAKRQKVADLVYSQQSVESIAAQLATDYLATGDVRFSKQYTDRIRAVTAEQVHAAARKYFTFDRLAVTRMVPPGEAAQAAAATQPTTQPTAEMRVLPNGLRVVLIPDTSVELVSMAFVSTGGVLVERPQTNGLGTFMTALTTKGAGDYDAEQIAAFFDRAGGAIGAHCGNNTFYWTATVLEDSFPKAFEIFANVIADPNFPAKEVDILRPKLLAAVDRVEESWFTQLNKVFRSTFFTNSPYGMLPVGSKDVLAGATAEQLAVYHREHIRAGSSVLAVCGNFDPNEAGEAAERLFADLPKGTVHPEIPDRQHVDAPGEAKVYPTDNQVAAIMVGAPGMRLSQLDDRLAADVLDTIISGFRLPSGWLHRELRGKRLVYAVHAYNWAGLAPGAFITYAACQPGKAEEVVGIIHRTLRRAGTYVPRQEEIDQAVNTILTAKLLENQAASDVAFAAALDELYGFGYDFRRHLAEQYGRITPEDVARVGKKYLDGPYVTVVTTPQPGALEDVAEEPSTAR